uniref:Uncharacterized protein n=1 Tax=Alexandrium monilatum TaxID=311494 RepID=A0A6T1GWJ5_9DINO
MATRQRPPTAPQPPRPGLAAPGLDAVYNWFNTVSSGGIGGLFGSGGANNGGLGNLFGGGSSAGAGGSPSSALSSLSPLGFVCKAPQLRPSTQEAVVTERIVDDQSSAYGRPLDSTPGKREAGASQVNARSPLSPRRDAASSSSGAGPQGAEAGGGASGSRRTSRVNAYEADKEDLLDQHVGYYLRHHPHIHALHVIARKRPGVYDLDGREIKVEWQYATEPGGQGFLVVLDGPLRQPFSDYMDMTEANAEYDSEGIGSRSALHSIPKEKRMSFHDQHKMYNRLEAMKVAKEQALVRERAADYVKDGREVPGDLMVKYKKTIQQKLDPGGRRASAAAAARQRSQEMGAAQAQAATPVRQPSVASPYPGAATPQPLAATPGPGGAGRTPGSTPARARGPSEEVAVTGTQRSGGDFVVPTADQPDTIAPITLEGLNSLGSAGAATPVECKLSDGVTRYRGQARARARTESPTRREIQWPSYVPPADAGSASYAPPVLPDAALSRSYVPPPMRRDSRGSPHMPPAVHEGLSRSYVPPVAPELQGAAPEKTPSHDWTGGANSPGNPGTAGQTGVGSCARPPPGSGPASGGGSSSSSPHGSQAPPASSGGWQGPTPGVGRPSAAQLLAPQPNIFGPPFGGAQLGPSPMGASGPPPAPATRGLSGLGGGLAPTGAQAPQQPQYAWWQQ